MGREDRTGDWQAGRHRRQPLSELDEYDRASIAVDCTLLTVLSAQLHVVVHRRATAPAVGEWALPGAFVTWPERDVDAVARALKEKVGLSLDREPTPLSWSGGPERDERGWVVTHVYLALGGPDVSRQLAGADAAMAPVFLPSGFVPPDAYAHVPTPGPGTTSLAFDHNRLVARAVARLRELVRTTDALLDLVAERFTLRDLQLAYEAVLGERTSRASFQRLVLGELRLVQPTGDWEPAGVGRRRAQFFERRQD